MIYVNDATNLDELFEQQMRNLREAARIVRGHDRPDAADIVETIQWAESRLKHERAKASGPWLTRPKKDDIRCGAVAVEGEFQCEGTAGHTGTHWWGAMSWKNEPTL